VEWNVTYVGAAYRDTEATFPARNTQKGHIFVEDLLRVNNAKIRKE